MKLHSLTRIRKQTPQRIGRGGKRGTTSGRGQKGQKSRAGHRIRPAERDLILKLPKKRGFRNKPKKEAVTIFNLGDLSRKLKTFAGKEPLVITRDLLITAGLLGKNFTGEIKILGVGEATFPMALDGIKISKSAKEKMEKVNRK
jgi:large subunit ribosomal protein L15